MAQPALALVLQRLLGRQWGRNLTLLLLFVFWPLAAFWRQIAFDPAHFVEEWIKLTLGGVVLVVAVEALRQAAMESAVGWTTTRRLADDLTPQIDRLVAMVTAIGANGDSEHGTRKATGNDMLTAWAALRRTLEALTGGPDARAPQWLLTATESFDAARVDRLLVAHVPGGVAAVTTVAREHAELIQRLTELGNAIAAHTTPGARP